MISNERQNELQKHAIELSMDQDLIDARPHVRPGIITGLSRLALNLDSSIDITMLDPVSQEELLVVMSGIRDMVNLNDGTDSRTD